MKSPKFALLIGAAMLLGPAPLVTSAAIADEGKEAKVAASDRPEADIKLDASRRPNDVLQFMGLKAGDKALDVFAGSGYYTRLMADIVGKDGSVVATNPPSFAGSEQFLKTWSKLVSRPDDIKLAVQGFDTFAVKEASYDFAMLHLIYHDAYWESEKFGIPRVDPADFLAKLYKAMKPGGTIAVVDHVGKGEDTRALVEATHRIDPRVVKADFAKAGFTLETESKMFVNLSDDHSKNVFDPAVRGKTDRFVFKFRKPKT